MKELLHSHMLAMQPRMGLSGSSVCLWSLQGATALPLLLVQIFWILRQLSYSDCKPWPWIVGLQRKWKDWWKMGFILIRNAKYKKRPFQGQRRRVFVPDWWRVITIWDSWQSSPLSEKKKHKKKNSDICGGPTNAPSLFHPRHLDLPTAVVVVMAVHVLHRDSAPHANHKRFDFALVVAAGDAEVTVLSPVLSPGVCSNLKKKGCINYTYK